MADISKIKLPDGTTYDIKDDEARSRTIPDKLPNPSPLQLIIKSAGSRRTYVYDGNSEVNVDINTDVSMFPLTITDENTLDSSGNATVTTYNGTSDASVTIPKTPDIPEKLPNPKALTIVYDGSGYREYEYDGSEEFSITIPAAYNYTLSDIDKTDPTKGYQITSSGRPMDTTYTPGLAEGSAKGSIRLGVDEKMPGIDGVLAAHYSKDLSIADIIYPVGSIYMSVNGTDPGELFGGTWEQLKDRFLLAAGDTYTAGSTGGAATHTHTTGNHTLTVNEIPSHNHNSGWHQSSSENSGNFGLWNPGNGFNGRVAVNGADNSAIKTGNTGGGKAHNHGNTGSSSNLPPYLTVYMWQRTA